MGVFVQTRIINSRRASAERVTVVVSCVCVCVCLSVCPRNCVSVRAVRAIKSITKDTIILLQLLCAYTSTSTSLSFIADDSFSISFSSLQQLCTLLLLLQFSPISASSI